MRTDAQESEFCPAGRDVSCVSVHQSPRSSPFFPEQSSLSHGLKSTGISVCHSGHRRGPDHMFKNKKDQSANK